MFNLFKQLLNKDSHIEPSEYYCTQCGAILNEHAGFSLDVESWTCACCGASLYGDNVNYEGERFKGILWYCDECGALLNNQKDFTDRQESWKCTECGFENRITADEIFDSEEDYINYKRAAAQIYKCSNCGALTHGPNCEACGVTLEEFRR